MSGSLSGRPSILKKIFLTCNYHFYHYKLFILVSTIKTKIEVLFFFCFQMTNNTTAFFTEAITHSNLSTNITVMPSTQVSTTTATAAGAAGIPSLSTTISSLAQDIISSPDSLLSNTTANNTRLQPLIFLQTTAAQIIAGTFAFASILITVYQVSVSFFLINCCLHV